MTVWFVPKKSVKLTIVPCQLHLTKTLTKEIDSLWKKENKERSLFDGEVFCINTIGDSAIEGFFVPYRYIFAQKCSSIRKQLPLYPLGVSAIVTYKDFALLGKRSSRVTQYKHYWECLPSGSIQRGVSPRQQIINELKEEAGIKKSHISSVTLLGLFYSSRDRTFDLGFHIHLTDKAQVAASNEYATISWRDIKELSTFFMKERRVVPLSCFLLDAYTMLSSLSFVSLSFVSKK